MGFNKRSEEKGKPVEVEMRHGEVWMKGTVDERKKV
jgi:hypothetical protein